MPSVAERLAALHGRPVNFDPDAPHRPQDGWRRDDYCEPLPAEPPGPPVDGGPFRIAQRLLSDYAVADPSIVRAHYDHDAPLEGRDMLLELRFLVFHTYAGCRVEKVTDETRTVDGRPVHVWGWPYRTLEGHVEQGQMAWEIWKWLDTGEIQFRIHSYSRFAGARNPFTSLGVRLFGQRERHRYLSHACRRMSRLTREGMRGEHPAGRDAGAVAGDPRGPAAPDRDALPTSVQQLGGAALLGAVCGIRTFTGPAVLALRGRVDGTPARLALTAAAAGEALGDKTPVIPARTGPPALAARVVSGALSGRVLAGTPGLAAGALGAVAGAFGAQRARTGFTELTGLPNAVTGALEDGVAVAAATLATRGEEQDAAARGPRLLYGAVRGAVAGVTATAAMTAAQAALRRATGSKPSRTPEKASRTVLRTLFGADVPRRRRDTLNEAAHWLYGTSWGVGLGVAAAARGRRPSVPAAGAALGLTAWVAEQVQLPALGVARPLWEQRPGAIAADAGLHLLHGMTAAAAVHALP